MEREGERGEERGRERREEREKERDRKREKEREEEREKEREEERERGRGEREGERGGGREREREHTGATQLFSVGYNITSFTIILSWRPLCFPIKAIFNSTWIGFSSILHYMDYKCKFLPLKTLFVEMCISNAIYCLGDVMLH